jgi:hypothetical protein
MGLLPDSGKKVPKTLDRRRLAATLVQTYGRHGKPLVRAKYLHIKNVLKEKIRNGEYGPGELLPSVRELSRTFRTTSATVGKAVRELALDKLVLPRPRVGIIVNAADARPQDAPQDVLGGRLIRRPSIVAHIPESRPSKRAVWEEIVARFNERERSFRVKPVFGGPGQGEADVVIDYPHGLYPKWWEGRFLDIGEYVRADYGSELPDFFPSAREEMRCGEGIVAWPVSFCFYAVLVNNAFFRKHRLESVREEAGTDLLDVLRRLFAALRKGKKTTAFDFVLPCLPALLMAYGFKLDLTKPDAGISERNAVGFLGLVEELVRLGVDVGMDDGGRLSAAAHAGARTLGRSTRDRTGARTLGRSTRDRTGARIGEPDLIAQFLAQRSPFMIAFTGMFGDILPTLGVGPTSGASAPGHLSERDLSCRPFLFGSHGEVFGVTQLGAISSSGLRPELCWRFLKYVAGEEAQGTMASSQTDLPVLRSAFGRACRTKSERKLYEETYELACSAVPFHRATEPLRQRFMSEVLGPEIAVFLESGPVCVRRTGREEKGERKAPERRAQRGVERIRELAVEFQKRHCDFTGRRIAP